jgi:hypothetical protein
LLLHIILLPVTDVALLDVVKSMKDNPLQLGLPRFFKILTAGTDVIQALRVHDADGFIDEGQSIFFSKFGVPGGHVRLNK